MNQIHIKPRQSGKTTAILERFFTEEKSIIVVLDNKRVYEILKQLQKIYRIETSDLDQYNNRICSVRSLGKVLRKYPYIEKILVDEYDFFTKYEKVYLTTIKSKNPQLKWCIYTTLQQQICKPLLQEFRNNNLSHSKSKLIEKYGKYNVDFLANTFYIDPSFKIIKAHLFKFDEFNRSEYRGKLPQEKAQLEIFNNIYKEPNYKTVIEINNKLSPKIKEFYKGFISSNPEIDSSDVKLFEKESWDN